MYFIWKKYQFLNLVPIVNFLFSVFQENKIPWFLSSFSSLQILFICFQIHNMLFIHCCCIQYTYILKYYCSFLLIVLFTCVFRTDHLTLNNWMWCFAIGKTSSPFPSVSQLPAILCLSVRPLGLLPFHFGMPTDVLGQLMLEIMFVRLYKCSFWH